jgi:cellulose synthase (UDP-forming)
LLWWIAEAPIKNKGLYILLSLALFYEYVVMPAALMLLALKGKVPANRRPEKNKKVAVITPCVPSQESITIIEEQLKAMAAIKYPHDSWILDEGGSKEIKKLARKHGVKYFTRKGVAKYNQVDYPFKGKTKAGNINAWLHRVKRYNYDFFVQMDVDHHPVPEYLDKTLGHFRDPKIAWVQAPSIYNNMTYWTARGSAEQDMGMQGPLQMGFYGLTHTPIIIGSHTTFRTNAIQAIGGFQATRAEDHLNTIVLSSRGWRGVFVPEAIAGGDGPETLTAYLSQQYAWARSMFQILKSYTWRYIKQLTPAQRMQFLFLQTWYPLSTISFMVLYFTPVVSLLFNIHLITISADEFIERFIPFLALSILLLWSTKPMMQPMGLSFSWRGILLHIIRWPVIFSAILSAIFNRQKPYQITPKGKFLRSVPTLKLYQPFLLLALISSIAMIYAANAYGYRATVGQAVFAAYDVLVMLSVCLIDLNVRIKQIRLSTKAFRLYWLKPIGAVAAVMCISASAFTYAFVAPQQTTLAFAENNNLKQNISSLAPSVLTDKELQEEIASSKYRQPENTSVPPIGIYSPNEPATPSMPIIRHTFMDWRENRKLSEELLKTERLASTPLITIEPKGDSDGKQLLNDITAGKYDQRLLVLINTMKLSPNTVYVRFAHEMDLPGVYAWGGQEPQAYISAYKHFVDLAQSHQANNLRWVWSPAGTEGSERYYPGETYVDVVGTTILYDRYWSNNYHPSFYRLQEQRAWLQTFGKPVWITEFGAGNADPKFQTSLLKDTLRHYRSYGYDALIYLNIPDSNINGPDYRLSDITILGDEFIKRKIDITINNFFLDKSATTFTSDIVDDGSGVPNAPQNTSQLILFHEQIIK